jgi:hypothetical protein
LPTSDFCNVLSPPYTDTEDADNGDDDVPVAITTSPAVTSSPDEPPLVTVTRPDDTDDEPLEISTSPLDPDDDTDVTVTSPPAPSASDPPPEIHTEPPVPIAD